MNRIVATMDDLPELPFELVLSYLSLEDLIKSKAVSRRWYHQINRLRVKTLCYSSRPLGFIWAKSRLVSGAFAQNFISSNRFALFFATFGPTILSNLKHLRLSDPKEVGGTALAQLLNSFGQLEDLGLFRLRDPVGLSIDFELNLPRLINLQLESVDVAKQLTLDAPRLRNIQLANCSHSLRLVIVHGESVERLIADQPEYTAVKNLKNLQSLYFRYHPANDLTLLSGLEKLKEIHLHLPKNLKRLFEQKQRYDRADLKIYLCGLPLEGPDDPAIDSLTRYFNTKRLGLLAENRTRLADEIPFAVCFYGSEIESVIYREVTIHILNKCTALRGIEVHDPIKEIERFLYILKNGKNIVELKFMCEQPKELFDQLPEHCAVQSLTIYNPVPDFLFRLKHLVSLDVQSPNCPIGAEHVRKLFKELPYLSFFKFRSRSIAIAENSRSAHLNRFQVSLGFGETEMADLEAAVRLIFDFRLPINLQGLWLNPQ